MSASTMAQASQITDSLRNRSNTKVQRLINNWDLLELMMEYDPAGVSRSNFERLLRGELALDGSSRFDGYKPYLLGLEDQRGRLAEFNNRFWQDTEVDAWLNMTADSSDHVQSVDDLEILYVDFGSPEQNVEMWWKVLAGTQPNAWRWEELMTDPEHLRLAPNAKVYECGIHRVRINLVANWEPENGRSVEQVRKQAAHSGELLAAAEVLAAYALHNELLRQQDGTNLPYADMAGFEATFPGGRPWASCPYLYWVGLSRRVELDADWTDGVSQDWAAPVLGES